MQTDEQSESDIGCGQVLIVDDLANWREALTDILQTDGHKVYGAAQADEALLVLSKTAVDVAILDLRLDDQDMYNVHGLGLLRKIRETSPHISILLLTGFPNVRLLEKAPTAIAVDALWFKNPSDHEFDIHSFRREIRALVAKARQCNTQERVPAGCA